MEWNLGSRKTYSIFQEAVENSDFALVRMMLKHQVYLCRNQRNHNHLTALQQSVLDGNRRMAVLLLENGTDIEATTSNGWTCLHIAAALGDQGMVKTLINHCASILAITNNKELPIDLAATPEIKIELAILMSKVGYNHLPQWYMEKLATREGRSHMLSTETLLAMACQSHTSSKTSYVQQEVVQRDLFMENKFKSFDNCQLQDQNPQFAREDLLLVEQSFHEYATPSNLFDANACISEVVYAANSDDCYNLQPSSMPSRRSSSLSVTSSSTPHVRHTDAIVDDSKMVKTMVVTPDEENLVHSARYGSLLRSGGNRRCNQKLGDKDRAVELVINYSNYDTSDFDGESEDILPNDGYFIAASPSKFNEDTVNGPITNGKDNQVVNASLTDITNILQLDTYKTTGNIRLENIPISDHESQSIEDQSNYQPRFELPDGKYCGTKTHDVSGKSWDDVNNCNDTASKKIGNPIRLNNQLPSYGLHTSEESNLCSTQLKDIELQFQTAIERMQARNEGNMKHFKEGNSHQSFCRTSDYPLKPRKRKGKLFSGIRSVLKDNMKTQRGEVRNISSLDDADILFAFSVGEKSSLKAINKRINVRRKNSFSEKGYGDVPQLISSNSRYQVPLTPTSFSHSHQNLDSHLNGFDQERIRQASTTEFLLPYTTKREKFKYRSKKKADSAFQKTDSNDENSDIYACNRIWSYHDPSFEIHDMNHKDFLASHSKIKSFNEKFLLETVPTQPVSLADAMNWADEQLLTDNDGIRPKVTATDLLSQLTITDDEMDAEKESVICEENCSKVRNACVIGSF